VQLATPPADRPLAGDDVYDDLLQHTRALRREHAASREAWLAALPVEGKVEHLFELEVLLKGLACFANPRNHPGPPRRAPTIAQDFREHTILVREVLARAARTCRVLLADGERSFVFHRYLDTVLPEERARPRLLGAGGGDTPERSLLLLRHGMDNLLDVTSGIARLPRVPFRLLFALLAMARREIAQSAYFNPLRALEFRPEFDRVTTPQLFALVREQRGEAVRRLIALTVLSLFRMHRYLVLVERVAADRGESRRRPIAAIGFGLVVLRSDARALSGYLRRRCGPLLAESYEADVLDAAAGALRAGYARFEARGAELLSVKATLGTVAAYLDVEVRKTFEVDLPAIDDESGQEPFRAAVGPAVASLRVALESAMMFLASSLGEALDPREAFADPDALRATTERLRRDLWMFLQILRAFSSRGRSAAAVGADGDWLATSPALFIRDFLAHFRAFAARLLRAFDYPRARACTDAMCALGGADSLDPATVRVAVDEADCLDAFLTERFDALHGREEIANVEFN
jgi:hypothetical protein